MSISNLSANVHESLQGRLAEFDAQRNIMHTVSFTDEHGVDKTMDIMAEDPSDAINKIRNLKNRD